MDVLVCNKQVSTLKRSTVRYQIIIKTHKFKVIVTTESVKSIKRRDGHYRMIRNNK